MQTLMGKAVRTTEEEIEYLEKQRDYLESILSNQTPYKALQSQKNGARTEFTDPLKVEEMLQKIKNKLASLK